MSIDWAHFTPLPSLAGGALIGTAAALLMLLNGRIAGVSGIFGQTLLINRDGLQWRLFFLLGLLLSPWVLGTAQVLAFHEVPLGRLAYLFVAGSLTGYGTFIANGCTSGHGICGLSRLSLRSLIAVATFMATGMATVTVLRLLGGASS